MIVNNLLGFTATPEESNSSRFATDIAKRMPIPIFHVNAEDPDAVMRVATIASEYRSKFGSDVVVDLIGYRRHGHSEVDDPTVTSPKRYALIKETPELYKTYAKRVGVDASAEVTAIQEVFLADQKRASQADQIPHLVELPEYWDKFRGGSLSAADAALKTGIGVDAVKELAAALTAYPESFHIHPKVKKLYEQRTEMGRRETGFRLWDGGACGVCIAGEGGDAGAVDGAGFAARHVQSAALCADGCGDRGKVGSAGAYRGGSGAV